MTQRTQVAIDPVMVVWLRWRPVRVTNDGPRDREDHRRRGAHRHGDHAAHQQAQDREDREQVSRRASRCVRTFHRREITTGPRAWQALVRAAA